jgi:hypothetical protein
MRMQALPSVNMYVPKIHTSHRSASVKGRDAAYAYAMAPPAHVCMRGATYAVSCRRSPRQDVSAKIYTCRTAVGIKREDAAQAHQLQLRRRSPLSHLPMLAMIPSTCTQQMHTPKLHPWQDYYYYYPWQESR